MNFNEGREPHFREEEKCSGNDIGQHVQDLEESAYTPVKIWGLDELDLI